MPKIKFFNRDLLNQYGITLISLIVTIIALLVLAGVSVNLIAGEEGILKKATDSNDQNTISTVIEEINFGLAEVLINYYEDVYVKKEYSVNTTKYEYILEKMSNRNN